MTKDDKVDQILNETPTEERPFHVVLVDIRKAATGIIHCVDKPLMGTNNLKFVALSYRWGELQETIIDTKLGYLANITSFDLDSFYKLCHVMLTERDLKDMDYVWIDAICVNQNDYNRRKETIYQMTNIYERANYIVAVPDLNIVHWMNTYTEISDLLLSVRNYSGYMYYLLHGNVEKVATADKAVFSLIGAPDDPKVHQYLTNYAAQFKDYNEKIKRPRGSSNDVGEITTTMITPWASYEDFHEKYLFSDEKKHAQVEYHMESEDGKSPTDAECLTQDDDALDFFKVKDDDNDDWPHRIKYAKWDQLLSERSNLLRNWVDLLNDFITDWSSRAWVINEYSIASRKPSQKLKLWFLQLDSPKKYLESIDFFEFDFRNSDAILMKNQDIISEFWGIDAAYGHYSPYGISMHDSASIYKKYIETLKQCIRDKGFIEKILLSKASRNEDRFYSILPSTKYGTLLTGKNPIVDGKGNFTTLFSVKLKIYERMDVEEKLQLLFMSGWRESLGIIHVLPTFATTEIRWVTGNRIFTLNRKHPFNFDIADASTLMLIPPTINDHGLYKLNIKPKEYYLYIGNKKGSKVFDFWRDNARLGKRLGLYYSPAASDLICIPSHGRGLEKYDWLQNYDLYIVLFGSLQENIWVLNSSKYCESEYSHRYNDGTGFNIY